jgi:mono/diheme cytochrome c family protein
MKKTVLKPVSLFNVVLVLTVLAVGLLWIQPQTAAARPPAASGSIPRGGALYDNWIAATGVQAPQGNSPLWSRQSTNTRSGADTWRCVSCHGWDYQGKDGAYRAGSNYTGFPNVYYQVQNMPEDEIVAHLKGSKDPAHDFSKYLDDASLKDLSVFLKQGVVDDNQYINHVTLKVIGGDMAKGKSLYDQNCSSCHGADGKKITSKFEGRDVPLGAIAVLDPWRFLHKTRYGTPGTKMVIGYDLGWTAEEGRNVLFYAQSFETGLTKEQVTSLNQVTGQTKDLPGGPAKNIFSGVLTSFGAMAASLGFALLMGAGLIGIALLIVWLIRGRK